MSRTLKRCKMEQTNTLSAANPELRFLSVSALCNKQEQPDADPAAVLTCMGRRE